MPIPFRHARLAVAVLSVVLAAAALAQVPTPTPPAAEAKRSEPARSFITLTLPSATDRDLLSAWTRWKKASLEADPKLAEAAQRDLIALKAELGIADLDAFSMGFIRATDAKMTSNDTMGAVGLATAAVELAPDLPHAHLMLARAYAFADPASLSRYVTELAQAIRCVWMDPRYRRPVIADIGVSALVAVLATTLAVIGVMFLRIARLFFHDFHHLFPQAAMRWQSAVFACVFLSLPVVLRLGVMPAVLIFFGAAAIYLSMTERAVAFILIGMVAFTPAGARWLASASSFPGTIAEEVYQLERGGIEASASADLITARAGEKKAEFEELFALGRYRLRRGQFDSAIAFFEAAAAKRSNEPRLLTNLGNAMLAKGDVQGAAESYTTATSVDASLVAPFYNLAVLYSRRAASEPPEAAVKDVQRAQNVSDVVSRLQPALIVPKDTSQPMLLNRSLLSPGLSSGEILTLVDAGDRDSKIESQLSLQLLGNVDAVLGWLYPVAIAIAFGGLSALLRRGKISKGCMRCGRQVCRRCDPQLSVGSALCQQCVNVFVRKNVVEPAVKIRKQIEIAQFRSEKEKLTYAFGLLCSGAGHVFSGLPIRGAIYVFLFLFALANILFRHGVLRYPYGAEPLFTRLAPLAAALIAVYLLSLRGLYKQQS